MGNVRIMGIDTGTANTGFAIIEGTPDNMHLVAAGLIRTKPTDGTVRERIDMIGNALQERIHGFSPAIIAVEDFTEQGKRTGKTYKEMAWITEHIRMMGRQLGYEVLIFKNGEWKKKTLGITRATKKQVMHYVGRKIPEANKLLKGKPDHVWDSVGIAICAMYEVAEKGEIA